MYKTKAPVNHSTSVMVASIEAALLLYCDAIMKGAGSETSAGNHVGMLKMQK